MRLPDAVSTFNPRTFTTPGILKSIKADLLFRFFAPHRAYLDALGVGLPTEHQPDLLDYDRLHAALTAPDARNPPAPLADAMAAVDDLANEAGSAALERELTRENPAFQRPDNDEDANFVLMVWLENPDMVERVNARNFAFEGRSYLSFKLDDNLECLPFPPPSAVVLTLLRGLLGQRFAHVYPVDSFRVSFYPEAGAGRFVIRHGGPLVREGIVDPSAPQQSESHVFRRELFDVVVVSPTDRELRIHARSKRDCDLYTRAFGAHLLNDEDAFPDADKYTLLPLITQGRASLACEHIEGLRSIKLTEFTIAMPGSIKESVTHRATDVFEIRRFREHGIPAIGRLVKARFDVLLSDARRARTVSIIVPNKAKYKRDSDGGLLEKWLRSAGFVLDSQSVPAEEPTNAAPAP